MTHDGFTPRALAPESRFCYKRSKVFEETQSNLPSNFLLCLTFWKRVCDSAQTDTVSSRVEECVAKERLA